MIARWKNCPTQDKAPALSTNDFKYKTENSQLLLKKFPRKS